MTTGKEAIQELLDGIRYLINEALDKAGFDRTRKGKIATAYSDGTYGVVIDGVTYTHIPQIGTTTFTVNQVVRVLIPEGQMANMVILGSGSGSTPTTGNVTSVNGMTGAVTITLSDLGGISSTSDLATNTVAFTEAASRSNINTGETASTLFGKVKKWFSDLKTVAFTGSYNDLSDTPSPYSLPIASSSSLGGIKVGTNLSIDSDGVLSSTGGGITDHSQLSNLDYANSGHTGFQEELTFDSTPTSGSTNPVTSGGVYTALDNKISYTNNTATVAGTSKTVSKTDPEVLYIADGLIMGGTAQAAGLVTRGVCGVSTPSATGACIKDNLYINFDGNSTNHPNGRGLVLNAGSAGTDLGNGMYAYCVPRGDVVKSWVENKNYLTANTAITAGTATKITYDSKGLVTAGESLSASDIPSLTLDKISDVTATASEVNVLDGITATTTELNYVDGVTSNIQTQLDGKADTSHAQAASTITAGTLAGQVVANATAVATLGTSQVRNIYAGTSDMTAGTTALTTGDIYVCYEA